MIAFVRLIRTISRSVTNPPVWNTVELVEALELILGTVDRLASGTGNLIFILSIETVLAAVTRPG